MALGDEMNEALYLFIEGCLVFSFSQIIWCRAGERMFEDNMDGC